MSRSVICDTPDFGLVGKVDHLHLDAPRETHGGGYDGAELLPRGFARTVAGKDRAAHRGQRQRDLAAKSVPGTRHRPCMHCPVTAVTHPANDSGTRAIAGTGNRAATTWLELPTAASATPEVVAKVATSIP